MAKKVIIPLSTDYIFLCIESYKFSLGFIHVWILAIFFILKCLFSIKFNWCCTLKDGLYIVNSDYIYRCVPYTPTTYRGQIPQSNTIPSRWFGSAMRRR
jgi:hypothetical protein